MKLIEICTLAAELGKDIDLTGCFYGPVHGYNHVEKNPYKYYYFLAGFCQAIEAKTVLEFGTHFGGSISAIRKAVPEAKLVTVDPVTNNTLDESITRIEGFSNDPNLYPKLKEHFPDGVDLIFVDSEHTFKCTSKTLELCRTLKPKYLIFDDIRLNSGMSLFWSKVRDEKFDCAALSGRENNCGFGVVKL
jgi:hypothetical protein